MPATTTRSRLTTAALVAVTLVLASCGDDSTTPATTATATSTTQGASPTSVGTESTAEPVTTAAPTTTVPLGPAVLALADNALGTILVDGDGHTLYLFTVDTPTSSACTDSCASTWPALLTAGPPELGEGLDAKDFDTITRIDGSAHVTFFGHPLYYFSGDTVPGDTNGHNVGGSWFVIGSDGKAIAG